MIISEVTFKMNYFTDYFTYVVYLFVYLYSMHLVSFDSIVGLDLTKFL